MPEGPEIRRAADRLHRQIAGRRLWRFAVFVRDGLPCHACAAAIGRVTVASRRLYICPCCRAAG